MSDRESYRKEKAPPILPQGIARVSGEIVASADQAFCDILGYDCDRVNGMSLSKLYRTEQGLTDFLAALDTDSGVERERSVLTSWCRADNTVAEVVVHAEPAGSKEKQERQLTVFDLTQANRLSRLERRHENTLEAILKHSPIGFCLLVLEPSGNRVIGWYTPPMARIFGYPEDEMIGASSRILFPNDASYRNSGQIIQRELKERGYSDFELKMMRRDKSLIDVHVWTIPVVIENEISMLTIVEDISKRKEIERALQESERRLDTIVRTAPSGIGILEERCIKWCNQALLDMSGYDMAELIGRNVRFLYPDEKAFTRAGEDLYRTFHGTGEGVSETTMLRKDGQILDVIIRIARTEPGNSESPIVTTVADVTSLKRAQAEQEKLREKLSRAQKLESVGRLAGGVAHDFNNLLTCITGNIALAQTELPSDHPLAGRLKVMDQAAFSAAKLTRQLLAFSRKQVIEPRVFDLNKLVEDTRQILARLIGEDIDLQTATGAPLGRIKADPGQVEQIIVNLAVNSRDAMPDGGTIFIETADVMLDDDYCRQHTRVKPGEYVMLSVSDTGMGMDDETQQKAFDPFFTTKGEASGTGLGLSTVHGIVRQHGGHMQLLSALGRGTTFKVYFPLVHEELQDITRRPVSGTPLPRGSEIVLVAEDDARVRKIAVETLRRQGYRVLHCGSGMEALSLVDKQAPSIDLLVTDVIMPKMNGRELALKLEERMPGLRVLYVSGYTDDIIAQHGILEPGIEFMAKPYTPEALARRVRQVLDDAMRITA